MHCRRDDGSNTESGKRKKERENVRGVWGRGMTSG